MLKISADVDNLTAKFFQSKEYFPIEVNFEDKEKIRILKRPRKTYTEIVDIYANNSHIGMFVGIEKNAGHLKFGPVGLNKSHAFRGILSFTFVRLLEYFGLHDVNLISIDLPEDIEFRDFLIRLGFQPKMNRLILEITPETKAKFLTYLSTHAIEVQSQLGQLQQVVQWNLDTGTSDTVQKMVNNIIDKLKNRNPVGKEFWANRKIAQLNYYITIARLFPSRLETDEFLAMVIKTIVASFESVNRQAYLEEILLALDNQKPFSKEYIQKMIIQLKDLFPTQIKQIDKESLRMWAQHSAASWKKIDENDMTAEKLVKENTRLKPSDFGNTQREIVKFMIQALVDHYNGEKIFFGVSNQL